MEMAVPFIEADPNILSIFKPEEIIRLAADINGAPVSILRTPDEMEEIRASQQEQQQQQQMLAGMTQAAPAMKDMAQAQAALPAEVTGAG
jgi:hypothetical protein